MNLKIKYDSFEIEIQHADITRIEKTLLSTFAYLQNEKVSSVLNKLESKPPSSKVRNYIEPIEGVRTHVNGLKEYKCAYVCKCGNSGVRYIHQDAEFTSCHKCKSELKVEPSTLNDAHDEDFNYFKASNL